MRFFPDMKSRSSVILAFGFGTLIVLIAILGFGAIRRARAIYNEMESTQKTYLEAESFRRDIAADMYLADILVRDYLLIRRRELLPSTASNCSRFENRCKHTQNQTAPQKIRVGVRHKAGTNEPGAEALSRETGRKEMVGTWGLEPQVGSSTDNTELVDSMFS